ncbi:MAG TPA: PP2C family protein-serine/threonine phosphatase [Thermoanaerobaculia bacterium]|nr:PP2C family protein-serine/threonine phosphatase [Thermoanaerobaculia bacterium]
MESAAENRRPYGMLLLGALVLAAGVLLARQWLPEWQTWRLPHEAAFEERHRETAGRLGVRLSPDAPRTRLVVSDDTVGDVRWTAGDASVAELEALGAGLKIEVVREGTLAGDAPARQLGIDFSPSGRPLQLAWMKRVPSLVFEGAKEPASPEVVERVAAGVLAPGETLADPSEKRGASGLEMRYDLPGTRPPQHLLAQPLPGGNIVVTRGAGSVEEAARRGEGQSVAGELLKALPRFLAFLVVVVLFFALLFKRRIDFVNGLFLGAISFVASAATLFSHPDPLALLEIAVPALFVALWVVLIWSTGESLLRSTDSSFTTSLDTLRAGRLGPRGGRALLYGLSLGAALGGLRLAVLAGAAALPGLAPGASSVPLPAFAADHSPFSTGILIAAEVMLIVACARRLLAPRWAVAAAIIVGALLVEPVPLQPFAAAFVANLVTVGLLVWLGRRFGLTALLTASIAVYLLPTVVLAASALHWLPVTFAVTAGTTAGVLVLGFVGLRRPGRVELERLAPPRFMRRLEEERRIKYEMDLLARMQLGLLPADVPAVPGWDIAARSLLATEAGGDLYDFLLDDAGHLWIAAGDVAGHGYSCSIVQAMTTAALTSLIGPGKSPAEVLLGVDRVIRRGGSHRNFTSLTLLRLDPGTGEAVLANAGHPYPLALAEGTVEELEIPGLPLGQGPRRQYRDVDLQIPPGGALVLCSDGLFEAVNWESAPYGFDRPREVLRTLEERPAAEILETLLADWKRHVSAEAPPDDTTVVVIKRAAFDRSVTVT